MDASYKIQRGIHVHLIQFFMCPEFWVHIKMARNLSNAAASLLPYSTIEAAASGNVDAINAVLKHYERYIAALATRTLYDENGVPHLCLDEEKLCRMRTKLITKILDFKVNKTA